MRFLLLWLLMCGSAMGAEVLILSAASVADLRGLVPKQLNASARPEVKVSDEEGFLRFDGKDDYLHVPGPGNAVSDMTVFIVAAPHSNHGSFRGLFAAAPNGANDYNAGLNIDLGPAATTNLDVVNVESAGTSGWADLLQPGFVQTGKHPFGGFHLFTVRSKAGPKGNELFVDGLLTGTRARTASKIGLDHFVVGARLYSNDPSQPPFIQGFFKGDVAAVVVYDRALSDGEREQVEQRLFSRVPRLNAIASGEDGHSLETVANPPVIQMLSPGFSVHELPLKISNINNVRYRRDGKLVALGYDGRIHLLSDTDGDGLEDKDDLFWDKQSFRGPIGMALLDDARGEGVFVSSKGKVSLILDRDRDGRGDEEIIVASGWQEIFQGVDALGVVVDPKDQSIYFALGTENFADGYLHDGKGGTRYNTNNIHGTIQHVTADFKTRETIATGVRFNCAMAFNREGDLFATDQEGATWLPNGNPLDELLEIVPGRHYGFPPRHPKNLPNVIDEPPIVEYGPQHQSTVGMVFNEGVNGGPPFGPVHWAGDAIICGESRGKLYRTKLVKTSKGYVGQNFLIACLGMLTVDACVSPKGELVVSCHSGPPDWGTGPTGEGRLFKIRYERRDVPQITAAWAAAPDEFHIGFDRPLSVKDWAGAKEKIRIEAGRYVNAGDRFEVIRPGYQVVREQMSAPRRSVPLQSLSLSADGRTLILQIPRQTEALTYAVTLPTPAGWLATKGIEQRPEIDVAITLNGAIAADESNRVVIPHPSISVSKALTIGSAEHEKFFAKAGPVKTETIIDTSNIFIPATQPGATLDWDISKDEFANRKMTVAPDYSYWALDEMQRGIPLTRAYLPWARRGKNEAALANKAVMNGNWLHGRRLFFGAATCGTCHAIRGEGSSFGPDLSNLVFRDRESVTRDIAQPSATINPDHTGAVIRFRDGSELNGIVKTLTAEKAVVRLPGGIETERARTDVISIEATKTSLMPEGLAQALSKEQLEDLLTFLLTNPLEPAPISRLDPPAPPARTLAEVKPFLTEPATNSRPIRLLLCAGPKDHGIDEHDYPLWLQRWSKLLALADNVSVSTNTGFPSREQLARADVTVFFSANPSWNLKAASLLDEYQKRGGGLVYLHYAVEGGQDRMALAERIGLSFYASAFRHGPLELNFTDSSHPITRGFSKLNLLDESYWKMHGDPTRLHTLATSMEDKEPRPLLWTYEREKSRVFVGIPGHYTWTFDDPAYRILVLRGIAWTARETDINRFNELALIGARRSM